MERHLAFVANLFIISVSRKGEGDLKVICLFSPAYYTLFQRSINLCASLIRKTYFYDINNNKHRTYNRPPPILRYYKLTLLLHPSSVSNK